MEILFVSFLVFMTGACIGSFLNVVALRALTKESIIFPSSKCPNCSAPIKWYDNIPIFSYFFTFRGKCRNCGEKVSKQYPLIEALTATAFLGACIAFGFSIKTLLILFLFCISLVIIITDIKKEYVFEVHAWILIACAIIASLYFNGIENYTIPAIGLIAGVVIMEAIARCSYFLIKKKTDKQETDKTEQTEVETADNIEDENFDINVYIEKNKRAFGEGDTYLAAASGALLGWQYLILAIFMAIILQALCILPQFAIGLYREKHFKLLFSLSSFLIIAIIYWTISNLTEMNLYVALVFSALLLFFAIDTIMRLKKTVSKQGFSAIPFGPSLLISTFLVLFFGQIIAEFLNKHIFI